MTSLPFDNTALQKKILSSLLKWYKKDGRHDMPWRKTNDPYAIFISEFMLQQTTVQTVKPYYERFIKKFPTPKSLAEAELDDVLALWSGLGYYARARNLKAAMMLVQKKHKGIIPSHPDVLLTLPGVGHYTAGAIATLAYNKPAAALDANIIRVLMRLVAIEDDPKLQPVQVLLQKVMLDLTVQSTKPSRTSKKNGPRDVVLALMDIGATVCLPRTPQCLICPLSKFCLANKHGRQQEIPPPKEKLDRPVLRRLFSLFYNKGKWLVGKRLKEGLFGGLWEFPGFDAPAGVNPVLFLEEGMKEELKASIRVREAIPAFTHQLTHKNMIIRPYVCLIHGPKRIRLPIKNAHYDMFKWVSLQQLGKLGISSVTRRIINQLDQKNSV